MKDDFEQRLNGAIWRKAAQSQGNGGNCVQVAAAADRVAFRDSKNTDRPWLTISSSEWSSFLANVKVGCFDLGSN